MGYTVHIFASAEEFLQSAPLNETSCVIADVQMSVMSGLGPADPYAQAGLSCAVHFHNGLPR
jgi:FixJ family two-component response regulator